MNLVKIISRQFGRSPGFSLAVTGVLAIGIAAASLLFAIVRGVLLQPLPYRDADSVVWIWSTRVDRDKAFFSLPNLEEYQMQNHTLQEMAAFGNWGANLTGTGPPRRLQGARVTANAFEMLGAKALLGRALRAQDDNPQNANVVLLSHPIWQEMFGGAREAIGKVLVLNGDPYIVAGVLPADFLFPGADVDIVAPLRARTDPRRTDRGTNFLRVFARMKPGISISQVSADMATITERLKREYPDENAKFGPPRVLPLREELFGSYRTPLYLLQASVLLVLLIAVLNFANLTFVRSWSRRQEVLIRAALGASRKRLVLESLSESVATAFLGGLLGLLLARAGWKAALLLIPVELPRASNISIDVFVVLFCLSITLLIGIAIGLSPALAVISSARAVPITARGDSKPMPVRNTLIVMQLAISSFLLLTTVLLLKSFHQVKRIDPGFSAGGVLSLRISLPPAQYSEADAVSAFYQRVSERWQAIPGAESVALANVLPLSKMNARTEFVIVGRPLLSPADKPAAQNRWVSTGYFHTMKIPLVRGRMFTELDRSSNQKVAIVDEALAAKYFATEDPVGKHIRMQLSPSIPEMESEIIGVVRTVKHFTLEEEPLATLYSPFYQIPAGALPFFTNNMSLVVRSSVDPLTLAESVRRGLAAEDPNIPASFVQTMDSWFNQSIAVRRFQIRLLLVFAGLSLIVSLSGVYAVVFYIVVFRWRDFAIRMAIGASPKRIVYALLRNIIFLVTLGIASALMIFALSAKFIGSLLYGVMPWDANAIAAIIVLMVGVSAVAGYLPARKAGKLDPAFLLRTE